MFKVLKEKVYFEDNVLRLYPVLGKAENRKLVTCILLAVYYGGPWAKFPENERWANAKKRVYKKSDFELQKEKDYEECLLLIESFQYDEKRQTIRNYLQKIHNLNDELIRENNPKKIGEIDTAIERLSKRVETMEREQDMIDEAVAIKGGGKLSFLEKWQERMRENAKKKEQQKYYEGVENITEQIT